MAGAIVVDARQAPRRLDRLDPRLRARACARQRFPARSLGGRIFGRIGFKLLLQLELALARETLAAYNQSDFLYERDATGNRRLLDEAETAAAKAKAQADVDARCAQFPESAP